MENCIVYAGSHPEFRYEPRGQQHRAGQLYYKRAERYPPDQPDCAADASLPVDCMNSLRSCSDRDFPIEIENNVMTVINPSPPTWISARITSCPKTDQCVKVSYTTSPVTQVAEVEVKTASRKRVGVRPLTPRAVSATDLPLK